MRRIDELHLKHPFMGARMLRDQLALEDLYVKQRHIGKLIRSMGIEALAPQPGTSKIDYFDWYNTERPHSKLDRQTPQQTYMDLLPTVQQAA